MAIPREMQARFNALLDRDNAVALVETKTTDGEPVYLICGISGAEDGSVDVLPLARLLAPGQELAGVISPVDAMAQDQADDSRN